MLTELGGTLPNHAGTTLLLLSRRKEGVKVQLSILAADKVDSSSPTWIALFNYICRSEREDLRGGALPD